MYFGLMVVNALKYISGQLSQYHFVYLLMIFPPLTCMKSHFKRRLGEYLIKDKIVSVSGHHTNLTGTSSTETLTFNNMAFKFLRHMYFSR